MDKRLIRRSLLITCPLATPPTTLADGEPTPRMALGTHYKEGAEYKIDIGTDLIIKGRVLAMPNGTAIAHARIEH